MKVHIGTYTTWIGPYQVADWLKYVGVSEDKCYEIGKWLSQTWVGDFLQWIHDKKKRIIRIRIDDYDVWSANYTMALIILPILQKLQESKVGSGLVDDEDVPEHIRSTADNSIREEWEMDKFVHDRWSYVLSEMIWGFQAIVDDGPDLYDDQVDARLINSTRLFGKYYLTLWD